MAGGYFGSMVAGFLAGKPSVSVAVSAESVSASVSSQPLLWYRMLPNATYGAGILAGLSAAVLPLIVFMIYLVVSKKWKLNIWQALAIVSPLLAFLVVGLIVSTKIGGGGDLHNMDMFLIGLMFAAVIMWEKSRDNWFGNVNLLPVGIKITLLLLLILPGFQSLAVMRSHSFAEDASWLVTLTDLPDEASLEMYPSREVVESAFNDIQTQVALAGSSGGEILFLDQRQLLTFGFIEGVPLVPEYEKKLLMDKALRSDANYFKTYYADLAAKRFALIVSEPLHTPVKDSSFQFGEENNAWVKWVSKPTLCYYEPVATLKEVGVQLLVPKVDAVDCLSFLPEGSMP